MWTGFIWVMTGSCGRLLCRWLWTFGFHIRWGICWLTERLLASQEGLCFIELVYLTTLSDFRENNWEDTANILTSILKTMTNTETKSININGCCEFLLTWSEREIERMSEHLYKVMHIYLFRQKKIKAWDMTKQQA